jgi:hypothetical protein
VELLRSAALYQRAYESLLEGGLPPSRNDEARVFEEKLLRAAMGFAAVARDTNQERRLQ